MSSSHMVIVERQAELRQLLEELFTRAGYTVYAYSQIHEASIHLCKHSSSCQLLVLDLLLTDIEESLSFLAFVRDTFTSLPVLVLREEVQETWVTSSLECWHIAFLVKPYHPTALLLLADQLIKQANNSSTTFSPLVKKHMQHWMFNCEKHQLESTHDSHKQQSSTIVSPTILSQQIQSTASYYLEEATI